MAKFFERFLVRVFEKNHFQDKDDENKNKKIHFSIAQISGGKSHF